MQDNVLEIVDIGEIIDVGPLQTRFYRFNITDNSKVFTIADIDQSSQELCLRAWFTVLEPFDRVIRFSDFGNFRSVQRERPLKIQISSTSYNGSSDINTIKVPNGNYFINLQNVSGKVKISTIDIEEL